MRGYDPISSLESKGRQALSQTVQKCCYPKADLCGFSPCVTLV